MSPLQDMAAGQQGVSKTQKEGPKPVPSSLQDRDMMSIGRGGDIGMIPSRIVQTIIAMMADGIGWHRGETSALKAAFMPQAPIHD